MLDGEQETGRPPLLALAGLAARWGIPEKDVIAMVRRRAVPFLRMTQATGRVRWDRVRFSLPAIEAWEHANQERFAAPVGPPPAAIPAAATERLNNWRRSAPSG